MSYGNYYHAEYQLSKGGDHRGSAAGVTASSKQPQRDAIAPRQPAWAKGLQRLYDNVVDEALPDDLARLLDKLDRAADGK